MLPAHKSSHLPNERPWRHGRSRPRAECPVSDRWFIDLANDYCPLVSKNIRGFDRSRECAVVVLDPGWLLWTAILRSRLPQCSQMSEGIALRAGGIYAPFVRECKIDWGLQDSGSLEKRRSNTEITWNWDKLLPTSLSRLQHCLTIFTYGGNSIFHNGIIYVWIIKLKCMEVNT